MAQMARMRWTGGRIWGDRSRRLASEGLERALLHTLGVADKRVPLDEGTLRRSGKVNVSGLHGTITFDTPYAIRQHENLTYRHLPGRTAKYLEGPLNEEREVMLQLMAVPLRRWLRG